MKLEEQVIDIDTAKQLDGLEFREKSYFAWFYLPSEDKWEVAPQTKNGIGLPAYTIAELFKTLPILNGTMPEIIKGVDIRISNPIYHARYYDQNIMPQSSENMTAAVANLVIDILYQEKLTGETMLTYSND